MGVSKIVLTGGPCGGKSTGLKKIQEVFTARGYTVLIIEETATELIPNGLTPGGCLSQKEYQKCQMSIQMAKESVFDYASTQIDNENILIFCDRGAMDNRAYLTEEEFVEALEFIGYSEEELLSHYDAVFHLVTAAKGAEEFYTTENNVARTETVEEAAALDDRILLAWQKHPYVRIIDNAKDFDGKIQKLMEEITYFLEREMN
ncbi:MAG: ATP-binding protein [Eubacteriales bacterium]|nr:ATP-binding protein [Eubacteriales bacterium]